MMQVRGFLMAALALACADLGSGELSNDFRDTPFRYLRGVDVGMTGKRLHELRPGAHYSPYLGLQERIPGFIVSYQFPTAMSETATDVGLQDLLQGVFITESFDSMEKAEASWREKVRAVTASHRAPDECDKFATGGMQARWITGNRMVAIGAFPKEPTAPTVMD